MLNIPQSDPQLTPEVPPRSNVSVENSIPAAGENVNPKIWETLPEGQGAKSAEFCKRCGRQSGICFSERDGSARYVAVSGDRKRL